MPRQPHFMVGPEKLASQRLRRRAVAQAASAPEGDDVGSFERLFMQPFGILALRRGRKFGPATRQDMQRLEHREHFPYGICEARIDLLRSRAHV